MAFLQSTRNLILRFSFAANKRVDARTICSSSACRTPLPVNSDEIVEKYGISHDFVNRNPRNLEMMGIAYKRRGWRFQAPRKDFYHKLVLERSSKHIAAKVVHCSGATVLSASTQEKAIAKRLNSTNDVNAAKCVGLVIAHRCLQAGIECLLFDEEVSGERISQFQKALVQSGLELTEPDEDPYGPDHIGTDYDKQKC